MANTKSTSRDIGLDGGAGKGDAPRNMSADYYRNFEDISGFDTPGQWKPGWVKSRGGWRRVYR